MDVHSYPSSFCPRQPPQSICFGSVSFARVRSDTESYPHLVVASQIAIWSGYPWKAMEIDVGSGSRSIFQIVPRGIRESISFFFA